MSRSTARTLAVASDNMIHSLLPVQEAVGEPAIKEAHAKKWQNAAERTFVQIRDRRLAESSQQVEVAINKMNAKLNQLTAEPQTSSNLIGEALNGFLEEYVRMPEGPTKWQRLVEFMQSTLQVLCLSHLLQTQACRCVRRCVRRVVDDSNKWDPGPECALRLYGKRAQVIRYTSSVGRDSQGR